MTKRFLIKQNNALSALQTSAIVLSLIATSAVFGLGDAHAQTPQVPAPEIAASAAPATKAELPAPRYAASDLERAFKFMDANHDDKISRSEAAGFRGVARHFEQADTNQDGYLSRDEFGTAMNYVKPQ